MPLPTPIDDIERQRRDAKYLPRVPPNREFTSRWRIPSWICLVALTVSFAWLVVPTMAWTATRLFHGQSSIPELGAFALTVLFFAIYLLYRRAGIIQLVFLISGLGMAYGYGGRFSPARRPRSDSDYDVAVWALSFVRPEYCLDHDSRVRFAVNVLQRVLGKDVDITFHDLQHIKKKKAFNLINPLWFVLFWIQRLRSHGMSNFKPEV
jgi:hypothetical protein